MELILEHAGSRSDESLGVITMGIEHANRISMALARARDQHPALDGFFDSQRSEPFFVKNLERVQGDERDAIILSIGYGKNETGDLVYHFGPLLQDGGERRLNVAITRARRRMTVVSSFSHEDMRPDYPKLGVRLLRGFLEYAAAEGRHLSASSVTDVALNEFEQSVFDELERQGLKLVGQVGSSRYRIDMVAMHPLKPGRFVLAIECDGACVPFRAHRPRSRSVAAAAARGARLAVPSDLVHGLVPPARRRSPAHAQGVCRRRRPRRRARQPRSANRDRARDRTNFSVSSAGRSTAGSTAQRSARPGH